MLTSNDTLSFWQRYFSCLQQVELTQFFSALQQEYYTEVLADLDKSDDFLQELFVDIGRKVSVDEMHVSMNALELWTRDRGLEVNL